MPLRHLLLSLAIAACWFAEGAFGSGVGTVELDLVGDTRGSAMLFQDWVQALGKGGIRNVHFRAVEDVGKPQISVQGTGERPVYVVRGIVKSRDELALPGKVFRRNELDRLAAWLKDLAENGPPDQREPKSALGLTRSQIEQVRNNFVAPVGFSTQGMASDRVAEKIVQRLKSAPKIEPEVLRALSHETVTEELTDVASGTALAYVLQSAGYGLTFRAAGENIAWSVAKIRPGVNVWPVGMTMEDAKAEVLPALFEYHTVNVEDYSAADALKAIATRLKTPVLIDHKALARHSIDPAKKTVSLPQTRTTYGIALRKLLFQAGLRYEVRCDEADTAFLWVTSVKPQ